MTLHSQLTTFRSTLEVEAPNYKVNLASETLDDLTRYYEHLHAWNDRLHLVAPCPPREFATRHVLESLLLLKHFPNGARIADIGSGAGLPIIPCLIARADLYAILIEASRKKAIFLREALHFTATSQRGCVSAERFENMEAPEVGFVTCRALERFEKMLPQLFEWAPAGSKLLLFGGKSLGAAIEGRGFDLKSVLVPNSRGRFLHIVQKS